MDIKIIGVYLIDSDEPCHLIELTVHEVEPDFDMGSITQELPYETKDNWQVPYDEHFLTSDGSMVLNPDYPDEIPADDNLRVAFYFHYLDFERTLKTPIGDLYLPKATKKPERLNMLIYDPPY